MRAFEEKFGIVVLEGYGLSETASTASFNISAEERRAFSVGKPIWGVQMRIHDVDDNPLPPGKDNVGEIVIRGHNVMKGYLGREEATAEAFRNGWFHTGDLGYVDEDGFFFIVDRSKDLVIRGGYNVYPREIEEVLFEHPDIVEAAVIGKPDDRLGEEVVAVVVAREGAQPERAGRDRLHQGAARGLQVPARGALHRRAAEDADRQDPQGRAARSRLNVSPPASGRSSPGCLGCCRPAP